jgi:hypothetical protein
MKRLKNYGVNEKIKNTCLFEVTPVITIKITKFLSRRIMEAAAQRMEWKAHEGKLQNIVAAASKLC